MQNKNRSRYTTHARIRMRQRGFAEDAAEHILTNGKMTRTGRAWIIRAPRQTKKRAAACPSSLRDKRAKSPYIVMSDEGAVITAAYRTQRVKRDITPHQKARRNSRRKI